MYTPSEKSNELLARLSDFMEQHVYPNESRFREEVESADNRFAVQPLVAGLKRKAWEEL